MGINPDDMDKFHAEIRRPIDELNSVRQQILADFKACSRIWDEIEQGPAVPEPSTSMMTMIMMQRMIDNTPWRHPAHNRFHL
jgi:hypothetical protein